LNPIVEKCDVKQKYLDGPVREDRDTCCNRLKNRFRMFDTNYFSPLFIKTVQKIHNRNNSIVTMSGFDRRNLALEREFINAARKEKCEDLLLDLDLDINHSVNTSVN
jgi:hypothetical protein